MPFKQKNVDFLKDEKCFLYGHLIRKAREDCEISLLFLSEISGLSSSLLSRVEHGESYLLAKNKELIESILDVHIDFSDEINQMMQQEFEKLISFWASNDSIEFANSYNRIKSKKQYYYSCAHPLYMLSLLFYEVTINSTKNEMIKNIIKDLNHLIELLNEQQKNILGICTLIFFQNSNTIKENNFYVLENFDVSSKNIKGNILNAVVFFYLAVFYSNSGKVKQAEKYEIAAIGSFLYNMCIEKTLIVKIVLAKAYLLADRFEEAKKIYEDKIKYREKIGQIEKDSEVYLNLLLCAIFEENYILCKKYFEMYLKTEACTDNERLFYGAIVLFLTENHNLKQFLNLEVQHFNGSKENLITLEMIYFFARKEKVMFEKKVLEGLCYYKNSQCLMSKKLFLKLGIKIGKRFKSYKYVVLIQEEYILIQKEQLSG